MKYAKFDEKGFPIAFYDKDIHGDSIPEDVIEITDEQWMEFLENQGNKKWDFKNNTIIDAVIEDKFDLDEYKDLKKREIKREFLDSFKNGYNTSLDIKMDCSKDDLLNLKGALEYAQYNNQTEIEIRDYDNNNHTISLDDLQKIINEILTYHNSLFKKKWQLEQEIDNCKTYEEIDNIKW